ncbi:MAG: ABC transporter ATP-binding protein [Firmicutes bacterium]|nr:ABC transporter ATP-binding protein [Bacillota bacterium]MCL5039978.1 ABC transporter ATP-binding protein [Bacillota bacterium]
MPALLETKGITMRFNGQAVLDGVSWQVEEGSFKSIIGPNGAGKTTFFNIISGQLKPSGGQVLYRGRDITGEPTHVRAKMGIGRSFQITSVFPNLTVSENVRLAVQTATNLRLNFWQDYRKLGALQDQAHQYLAMTRLHEKGSQLAKNLTLGEKRKLELAMLLALEPEVLLLDEPTAGMALEEVPSMVEVIRNVHRQRKRTVLMVEHKIDLVLDLSDSIAVLFNGTLLADGPPAEIVRNGKVQAAYLGGLYEQYAQG